MTMVINCTRSGFTRDLGRWIFSSFKVIGPPSSSSNFCQCQFQSNKSLAYFTTRSLQTSASMFQLNPAAKVDSGQPLEPKARSDPSQAFRHLEELQNRQKKRLLEVPDDKQPKLIYKGILARALKRVKILSISTSICGLAMQPVILQNSGQLPMFANIAMLSCVGIFTYVTPILIHSLTKKYVTEIVYDPQKDNYTATTFTFFLRKRETSFSIDDVNVPDVPGMFTTITVKNSQGKYVPFFIAPEAFTQQLHYGRLMGYDKPIDLRLKTQGGNQKAGNKEGNT